MEKDAGAELQAVLAGPWFLLVSLAPCLYPATSLLAAI